MRKNWTPIRQHGGAMRLVIAVTLYLLSLTAVLGQDLPALKDLCQFKMDVTTTVYARRDQYSQEQMLKNLEYQWTQRQTKSWPHASYVDSQRIIRDAYRKSGGEYIRDCCTDDITYQETLDEGLSCLRRKF